MCALHLTPGDIVAEQLVESAVPGEVVPWRDALHTGPVPADLGDELLRVERAHYLADRGWAPLATILEQFAARDSAVEAASRLVLWFESDLYDQLQLLQVLSRLRDDQEAELVQVDRLGDAERFTGFGTATVGDLEALYEERREVSDEQRRLGRRAWAAFRAEDPIELQRLLDDDTAALPYLADALRRHLQEFPALGDGLSHTERIALTLADEQPRGPIELFLRLMALEQRPYLGDSFFWDLLAEIAREPAPLLEDRHAGWFAPPDDPERFAGQTLSATAAGRDVLATTRDRTRILPFDRWYGGVHLRGPDPAWRWDPDAALVVRAA
jgi:hypothetical protein